jgi:hypothetical protein
MKRKMLSCERSRRGDIEAPNLNLLICRYFSVKVKAQSSKWLAVIERNNVDAARISA